MNGTTISNSVNLHQFALDLDPQLVVTPINHIGFTAGVTGDIPIAGGWSGTTNTNGVSQTSSASASVGYFSINLGLLGWF